MPNLAIQDVDVVLVEKAPIYMQATENRPRIIVTDSHTHVTAPNGAVLHQRRQVRPRVPQLDANLAIKQLRARHEHPASHGVGALSLRPAAVWQDRQCQPLMSTPCQGAGSHAYASPRPSAHIHTVI